LGIFINRKIGPIGQILKMEKTEATPEFFLNIGDLILPKDIKSLVHLWETSLPKQLSRWSSIRKLNSTEFLKSKFLQFNKRISKFNFFKSNYNFRSRNY
jgi:hypothetical protein